MKNADRQAAFEAEHPARCRLIGSLIPVNILLGFLSTGDAFSDFYRYFLNLYYPKNDSWVIEGWDNYEDSGKTIMQAVKNEVADIYFDFEDGDLHINILGFVRNYYILHHFTEVDWTFCDVNDFIKSKLINEFQQDFKDFIFSKPE